MVNSLGGDLETIWRRLRTGDQSRFSARSDFLPHRPLVVAAIDEKLPDIPEALSAHRCRNNAVTLAALRQIEPAVRTVLAKTDPARVAVVMGTSTAGATSMEQAVADHMNHGEFSDAFHYPQAEFGGTAGFVAGALGITGPRYSISTACSSGARALASARSLLSLGLCDAVVAGATDTLCGLVTNGFSALHAVSEQITNPCSANRSGLTLGEGSAVFLVTAEAGGVQLRGVGESSEAHHMSAPDPSGAGAEQAMRAALDDAEVRANAIHYLNLHGTGTPQNDSMECKAVARVFSNPLPCSSTKPLVGHTLGAAGAIEAGICWMALSQREARSMSLPPHRYDGVWDPELPEITLVDEGDSASLDPEAEALAMSNSFGFGGNNCALILGSTS
ncbi:MAG: beta-ketoacyl-ACP synthase [Deltaproteobacteria bacterium]|nr:beta-ketoacyl-ACP synthase [Deltaproteobacteria bacterium]